MSDPSHSDLKLRFVAALKAAAALLESESTEVSEYLLSQATAIESDMVSDSELIELNDYIHHYKGLCDSFVPELRESDWKKAIGDLRKLSRRIVSERVRAKRWVADLDGNVAMKPGLSALIPVSWCLVVLSFGLAGLFAVSFGFVYFFMGAVDSLMEISSPRNGRLLWSFALILPLALMGLGHFRSAARESTLGRSRLWWGLSTLFYAVLTVILAVYLPATVKHQSVPVQIPIALFTGCAAIASGYFVVALSRLRGADGLVSKVSPP